ncbi:ethanolamine utilization protein EutH [Gemmobacter sp. 24YEA27]|uniref:ethanolamine utilization protein EutH n=1 Tax=Gemmobacter sp. 24YEA27 TaxID=3040672 RepID=UPI0024B356E4|nr:ethanolamine utilization protein EutH [Gemmobacter sp. 24YEA27]
MASIGTYIIWLIMVCAVAGAIAAIRDPEKGLGKEFTEGLHSIGPIFIPVAGIMAAIPYLSHFIEFAAGPLFALVGADPSIAATTVIAGDMGATSWPTKLPRRARHGRLRPLSVSCRARRSSSRSRSASRC